MRIQWNTWNTCSIISDKKWRSRRIKTPSNHAMCKMLCGDYDVCGHNLDVATRIKRKRHDKKTTIFISF